MKRIALVSAVFVVGVAPVTRAEDLQHVNQLLSTRACQLCNLQGTGLVHANLSHAQLQGADLRDANLSRAILSGADLSGADLSGASLNGANLQNAILTGASLDNTDLRDAYLVGATFDPGDLEMAYLQGAIGIPDNSISPEYYYQLGVAETEDGNYPGALEFYNRALGIDSEFAPAYLGRSVALYRQGDDLVAMQDAQTAIDLFIDQDNQKGVQAATKMLYFVQYANAPREIDEGDPDPMQAIGGIVSMLGQFLPLLF
ncbi:putative low-complexity protein [Rubidibacter lacunae KORDI 51-2]|uniref:Putative low-complexity protein n=1 Tax=Rubidibacter lacunae KORDI 51-2 TaxID=582515 RepID=U5DJR8_9CHRO|nr:pentapeptide repeat-containing protein [Rubidibacter lacunae]ERN39930.1 putative low-complexity protein [Rubidibacter lacunae KORDI 51-2]